MWVKSDAVRVRSGVWMRSDGVWVRSDGVWLKSGVRVRSDAVQVKSDVCFQCTFNTKHCHSWLLVLHNKPAELFHSH